MKVRALFLVLMFVLGACSHSVIIEENEFIKMSIVNEMPQVNNNWGNGETIVINDKNTIMKIIEKINNSPKSNLSEIEWEHGPELRIVFEGENNIRGEIKAFTSGTVVSENYEILAGINFEELINE